MSRIRTKWNTLADSRDKEDSRKLWEQIFPEDSAEFLDYYDTWKMKDNSLETRRSAGRLVSMIHWNPYEIMNNGTKQNSRYVVAVATLPEFRHRGLMAGQLRTGMERFRCQGMPFMFLMPADPEIYRPFDFSYIYDRREMILRPEDAAGTPLSPLEVKPLEPGMWQQAAELQERVLSQRFRLYTKRSRERIQRDAWECRSEGGGVEVVWCGSEPVGILTWWGSDPVEIRELILVPGWDLGEKEQQVIRALKARWPEEQELKVVTTGVSGREIPTMMGRILNVPAFLAPVRGKAAANAVIRIHDRYLKENDGLFLWQMTEEGSLLRSAAGEEADLEMNIDELMQWICGRGLPEGAAKSAAGETLMENAECSGGCFFPEIV